MSDSQSSAFWRMADAVVVINLDSRHDRWVATQQAIEGIIPPEKIERLSAVLGAALPGFGEAPWFRGRKRDRTWAGRAGVLLSHRAAILKAKQAGWRSVLILEDDVDFPSDPRTALDGLADALGNNDWDICYLGYTDPRPPFCEVAHLSGDVRLYRVSGCSTTHAYLLNHTTYDWLLSRLPEPADAWSWVSVHRAIDRWFYRNLSRRFKVLAVSPSIIDQRIDVSDITFRANEGEHTTRIGSSGHTSESQFGMRNFVRHLGWRLAEPRDRLRALIKRTRGF